MMKLFSFVLCLLCALSVQSQQTVGLFQNDSLSQNGYTLFAPGGSTVSYLIDNCGRIVNTWQSAYRPGEAAYLLENGNLLRTARIPGSYNGGGIGGRIEMFDWSGNLLWAYNHATTDYHAHHDVEYMPNGNILLIAWEGHSRVEAIAQGRNPNLTGNSGVWFEQVLEIEPVGTNQANIVWEWHLIDHLVQDFDATKANFAVVAEHPELLDANFGATAGGGPGGGQADWVHFNSVDYNPELDQIIVNSRTLNEFYVIDHSTTSAEAAEHAGGKYGKGGDFLYRWGNAQAYDRGTVADQTLWGQHDVHWIEEGKPDAGKIMIFNNGQSRPGGSYSSIDVLIPPQDNDGNYLLDPNMAYGPNSLHWTYAAPQPLSFYSVNISGAQRLTNGNTLICEGTSGHFFEVDLDGNTHWDYISPVSMGNPISQGSNPAQNSVFRAYRYAADYPAFVGKDLSPGLPVEANPLMSSCQIYDGTVAVFTADEQTVPRVFPNPVQDFLYLENVAGQRLDVQIFNSTGQRVFSSLFTEANIEINLSGIPSGIYFAQLLQENKPNPFTLKIIKR